MENEKWQNVPESSREPHLCDEDCLLIPVKHLGSISRLNNSRLNAFVRLDRWGVVNNNGDIIIRPRFDGITIKRTGASCMIIVAQVKPHAFERKSAAPAVTWKYLYGLYDAKGKELFPIEYNSILVSDNLEYITLKNDTYAYGVFRPDGSEVIPFGKYSYVDGFWKGFARVKSNDLWGIVDETGNIVLPIEYTAIWNFYGKDYTTIFVEKDDIKQHVCFSELRSKSFNN